MTKPEGISLRTIHICLVLLALLVSCYLIYSTQSLSAAYQNLSAAAEQALEMHNAASDLMEATDHLTELVQRYTLDGNSAYLHSYFEEALGTRDKAIAKMSSFTEDWESLEQLQHALDRSEKLIESDYYAMRLVISATGLSPIPPELQDIELKEQHAALPAREKKEVAQHLVSDEKYYRQKDLIRADMEESLTMLEDRTREKQAASSALVNQRLRWVRIVTVIQTSAILLGVWMLLRLGVMPILKAVDRIRTDSPIPVIGAKEFRYLAETYNKMYEVYKSSVASLNYKANHDELTKAYNRTGYELLLSKLELEDAAVLLLDIDLFKNVNDSYGHKVGDQVLQKVAAAVTGCFRSSDYVCRVGGDEFVVIMLRAGRAQEKLIAEKVAQINRTLSCPEDGLPPVTLSVGAAFRSESADTKELLEHADLALYETKKKGRNGITFYNAASN